MKKEERVEKLKHLITCLKCGVSGKPCDVNCPTQYSAGNMGEIIENLEEIAKALEQESCDDAVSRKAVITIIQNHWWNCRDIDKLVSKLPSVTPQEPKWIPVTERLPEERHSVLVWCPARKNIYCACYEEKQWWIFGAYWEKITEEVIAWQPLPKPYKEGDG